MKVVVVWSLVFTGGSSRGIELQSQAARWGLSPTASLAKKECGPKISKKRREREREREREIEREGERKIASDRGRVRPTEDPPTAAH
uniref:Putative secreted protein n=1 Tax=Anopheles darlingi TaxID=43151 RepID=A0A2M4DGK4_ANODA